MSAFCQLPLFQFHYGTIKREVIVEYNCYGNKFQFHYGTIKSIGKHIRG